MSHYTKHNLIWMSTAFAYTTLKPGQFVHQIWAKAISAQHQHAVMIICAYFFIPAPCLVFHLDRQQFSCSIVVRGSRFVVRGSRFAVCRLCLKHVHAYHTRSYFCVTVMKILTTRSNLLNMLPLFDSFLLCFCYYFFVLLLLLLVFCKKICGNF